MAIETYETAAEPAYLAYGAVVDYRDSHGGVMPEFEDLPDDIKSAWINASRVVWDLATTGTATY